MRAVEFDGVEHQVAALAQQNARALPSLRVVLCSSMGTTDPKPAPFKGGSVLFWKLNAEAFLMGSGLGSTIVKPCGLSSGEAGMHGLGVSHNDDLPSPGTFLVARADVAFNARVPPPRCARAVCSRVERVNRRASCARL